MVEPARVRRLAAVWLVVLALVTGACSWPGAGEPAAPYQVSYSGATGRLTALDQFEATEQLRDWARLGLASQLRLDRDQIVEALYDTTPIRDPAFAELVEQPTGPGRGLFDGTTLHVLVPQDDPHRSRTIGLLLDEHRADAGADPAQVQVHRYQIRPERRHIELFAEPPAPTGQIRADNGWREARVDQPGGLAGFLTDTSHLSRLETRGAQTWAAGWHWPDAPGAQVTAEDVAVLQRGYQQTSGPLPGFSLDPQPVSTLDDVRATIPGLAPALADAITSGNWAGSGYASPAELADLVEGTLFNQQPPAGTLPARGLPADRTQLWALRNLLEARPVYSQARYDGGLAGTEVGMTLFYTDLVAKDWTTGVGGGVPSKAVPGFVPDIRAVTPASICPGEPRGESGRLWFGQNDTAFTFAPTGVDIGAQATRLFARSDGPGGTEVEPSYSFGRGLRWWDQHYQQIADYEPQYHRLEQLMRWSGALEWLSTEGSGGLPAPSGSGIDSNLSFADWYAAHDELRERAPLTLVTPPSAKQEAVLPTPSATTPNCNLLRIVGGVSLADGLARGRTLSSDTSGTAALPPGMGRAGPIDPATTRIDPATGSGRIDQVTLDAGRVTDQLTRELRRGPDATSIETTGSPRTSIPFGEARLKGETEPRRLATEVRSVGRDMNFDMTLDGTRFASPDVHVPPSSGVQQTNITVQRGPLAYLQDAIKWIHRDPAHRLEDAPGVRYHYQGPQGTVTRYDNAWIEAGTGPTSSRISAAADVVTPGGVVEVRAVTPEQLHPADVRAAEVPQGGQGGQEGTVTTFENVVRTTPPDIPIYVAAEPAATLPGVIPVPEVRVRVRRATLTGDPNSPGPVFGENRTWRLADRAGAPTGSGGGGGPGGPGGPVGGGDGDDSRVGRRGPGGEIVLVIVCPANSQQEPQQSEECAG
ncbi:MAG: hypothetical protein M3R63_04480 [Actinomycetota bacterium]|nr:hypothetical protein [Actinomycetota bacterium]